MLTEAPRRSRGMQLLALGCTLLLSCTTVRTQVSAIPTDVVIEDGRAEPQIDLWIESNRRLSPEQERDYRAQARAALEAALAGRGQPEGDAVLVVRSQGISRTGGRRGDQTAATVGLVVGAVAIVTVVILAVIAGGKGGGHHASHVQAAPHAAPRVHATPRAGVAPPRFAPPGPVVAAPRRPFPAPSVSAPRVPAGRPVPLPRPLPPSGLAPGFRPYRHGGVDVGVGVEVWWWPVPVGPEPLPPSYDEAYAPPPPGEPTPGEGAPVAGSPDAAPPEGRATRVAIPAEPLTLDDRGFFDGDRLSLEALLLDRKTGEVLWTKRVSRNADPRDPGAVRKAMDELLNEGGWQPPAT